MIDFYVDRWSVPETHTAEIAGMRRAGWQLLETRNGFLVFVR